MGTTLDGDASSADQTVTVVVESSPSEAVEETLTPGGLLGRYVVLEDLGAGGMGRVVRAYDPKLRREVALKQLRRRRVESTEGDARLIREAQAMAQLRHPNVVAVYDVEVGEEGVVVVMEYVPGGTLKTWLDAAPRQWPEVLDIFIRAGQGLAAAHEAGLVHRDFKPANVMVAEDGRVEVTDFGLAKAIELEQQRAGSQDEYLEPGHEESNDSIGSHNATLTEANILMGTPRYMAPEQHRLEAVDARSDQYGFCVALWEALCGRAPFAEPRTLLADKMKGPPPWPRRTGVPEAIVNAIARGLAPEPENRFTSMKALLEALRYDPKANRRNIVLGLGAACMLGTAGVAAHAWQTTRAELCTGARAELAGIWDVSRRDELHDAIATSDLAYAESTWQAVQRQLDAYTDAWAAQHHEACEQTTLRGEQSTEVLDLRMACLWRAKTQLRAVIEVLAQADAKVVQEATSVVAALPSLSRCADLELLRSDLPPPEDDEVARAVERARETLARAKSLRNAGKYRESANLLAEITSQVEALGYRPLVAELARAKGLVAARLGDFDESAARLQEAMHLSLELRMQGLAGDVAADLAFTIGHEQGQHLLGLSLADIAVAIASGHDREGRAQAHARKARATMLSLAGRMQDAEEEMRSVLALYEKMSDPQPLNIANARANLGSILGNQGKIDDAANEFRQALETREQEFGPQHPATTAVRFNLAITLLNQRRNEEAEQQLRRVLDDYLPALGPDHPRVAAVRDSLGKALVNQEDKAAQGETELRAALDIKQRTLGPDHVDTGKSHLHLGMSLMRSDRSDEAVDEYRTALRIFDEALGPEHAVSARARHLLGTCLDDRGEYDEARAMLEAAWAVRAEGEVVPYERAATAFRLAKILWRSPPERQRARALAEQARDVWAEMNDPDLAEVEAWLKEQTN